MIEIAPNLHISPADLEERFVRSSGPGGQNVNKVATAVELRLTLEGFDPLPPLIRARLKILAGRKVNKDGVLVLQANRHRTQDDNRRDAFDRLKALILAAAVPPAPPRRRTLTPPAQKRARLAAKKRRSQVKWDRREPSEEG